MNDDETPRMAEPLSRASPAPARPPQRILLVDDDRNMRELSTYVLKHAGYHVDTANDGAAAWDELQVKPYDLLVTDNNMPKMSGVELLKKMRASQMALPVIMATGTLPTTEFAKFPELKPAATLIKPYTVDELLASVVAVLCASVSI